MASQVPPPARARRAPHPKLIFSMSGFLPNSERIASLQAGYRLTRAELMPYQRSPRVHCSLSKGTCNWSEHVDVGNPQTAAKRLRAHAKQHLADAVEKEAKTDASAGAASTSKQAHNTPTSKTGRPIKPLPSGHQRITCGWDGCCTMLTSRANFAAHVLGEHFQPWTSYTCPLCARVIAKHPTLKEDQPYEPVPVKTLYGGRRRWINATDDGKGVLQDILLEHYELADERGEHECGVLKKYMRRDYGVGDVLRDGWLEDRPPYRLKRRPRAALQARPVPARC